VIPPIYPRGGLVWILRYRFGCSFIYLPAVLGLLFSNPTARANPTGAQVANGAVNMESSGNSLRITASDKAIINWSSFSIGAGEMTHFVQPSATASVLNRVTSGDPSQILGTLQANGQVYLLNPNGIFVGNGAVIDVGGFMASTANLTDEAFKNGRDLNFTGASDAAIRNAGTITAHNGDVYLLAANVENTGTIRASQGTVGLMAGQGFLVKKQEAGSVKVMVNSSSLPGAKKGIGVDNRGTIDALRANLEADGNVYAMAINQAGVVRATGVNKLADGTVALSAPGGKIFNSGQLIAANRDGSGGKISVAAAEVVTETASVITAAGAVDGGEVKFAAEGDNLVSGQMSVDGATGKAGRIELTGDRLGLFDAKVTADGATGGGEVLVGGDYQGLNPLVQNASRTFVSKGSEISADATIAGDGGEVVVWSDNGTQFYGTISSQGGSVSGNGGFVEVSGKDYLDFRGTVNTLAANGQTGMLLLDPSDLEINNAATSDVTNTGGAFTTDNTANVSNLQWADINTQLATTSVTVNTGAPGTGGTGQGVITINQAGALTNLGVGRSLAITASDGAGGGEIIIGADITSIGGGSLIFTAPTQISIGAFTITTAGGAVTLNGPTVLTGSATFDTTNGGAPGAGAGITFDGSIAGTSFDLTLAAGVGNIMVNGAVGGDLAVLGNLIITSANNVTFGGALDITVFVQQAGTGVTSFQQNLNTGGDFLFQGQQLEFKAASGDNVIGGNINISNGGLFTTEGAVSLSALGGFTQDGSGANSLGGDVFVANDLTFQSGITLTGDVTLQSGSGSIDLQDTIGGNQNLTIIGTGAVTLGGGIGIGSLTPLFSLVVTGSTIAMNGGGASTVGVQSYTGAVTLGADTALDAGAGNLVTFGGTVGGATHSLEVGTSTSASNAQFDGVVSGLTTLNVFGTSLINTTGITTAGNQTYTGAVTLGADTALDAGAGNLVTFGGTVGGATHSLEVGTSTSASNAQFDGVVSGLTTLNVFGTSLINTTGITTAGNQTYTGAVTGGTVEFAAGPTGIINLANPNNDFTGLITIGSGKAITLYDVNSLSLAGASTDQGQVFVAGGTITTSGAHAISGVGDMLIQSTGGGVTLGGGTTYSGRNITVAVGPNQSLINQAGNVPFQNNGGRTLVFSTKVSLNQPTSLNAGLKGFQPYFQQSPIIVPTGIGTYTVGNTLPGGNLTVYSTPFSVNVTGATLGSISSTEAYQTAVPIVGYSLGSLSRQPVQIQYRGGTRTKSTPRSSPERAPGEERGGAAIKPPTQDPFTEAKLKFPIPTGSLFLRQAHDSELFCIGNISIGSGQISQVP